MGRYLSPKNILYVIQFTYEIIKSAMLFKNKKCIKNSFNVLVFFIFKNLADFLVTNIDKSKLLILSFLFLNH